MIDDVPLSRAMRQPALALDDAPELDLRDGAEDTGDAEPELVIEEGLAPGEEAALDEAFERLFDHGSEIPSAPPGGRVESSDDASPWGHAALDAAPELVFDEPPIAERATMATSAEDPSVEPAPTTASAAPALSVDAAPREAPEVPSPPPALAPMGAPVEPPPPAVSFDAAPREEPAAPALAPVAPPPPVVEPTPIAPAPVTTPARANEPAPLAPVATPPPAVEPTPIAPAPGATPPPVVEPTPIAPTPVATPPLAVEPAPTAPIRVAAPARAVDPTATAPAPALAPEPSPATPTAAAAPPVGVERAPRPIAPAAAIEPVPVDPAPTPPASRTAPVEPAASAGPTPAAKTLSMEAVSPHAFEPVDELPAAPPVSARPKRRGCALPAIGAAIALVVVGSAFGLSRWSGWTADDDGAAIVPAAAHARTAPAEPAVPPPAAPQLAAAMPAARAPQAEPAIAPAPEIAPAQPSVEPARAPEPLPAPAPTVAAAEAEAAAPAPSEPRREAAGPASERAPSTRPLPVEPALDEAELRAMLARDPHDSDARVALAALLASRGEQDASDQLLAELESAPGESGDARQLGRIEVLARLGRAGEAQFALDALPASARESGSARMSAARVALAAGRADDAVRELAPAAEAPGASAAVLALYARALLAAGRTAEASEAYAASVAEDRTLPEALLGRAEMAVRSRRPADALRILSRLERALASEPRPPAFHARVLFLRGRAQLMAEQRTEARRTLTAVVRRADAPSEAWFFLAESRVGVDYRGARDAYRRYLDLEPDGYYARRARNALGLGEP